MDAGKLNSSVFTDLKKAFNIVDHNILLRKLCCYGVNVNALQLLKSYFTDRTQRCYVNGVSSTKQYVSFGIPQGSILGPLLFIIYLYWAAMNKIFIYARPCVNKDFFMMTCSALFFVSSPED